MSSIKPETYNLESGKLYLPLVVVPLIGYGFDDEGLTWWNLTTVPGTQADTTAAINYFITSAGKRLGDPFEFKFGVMAQTDWEEVKHQSIGLSISYMVSGDPVNAEMAKRFSKKFDRATFESFLHLKGVHEWVAQKDTMVPYLQSLLVDYVKFLFSS